MLTILKRLFSRNTETAEADDKSVTPSLGEQTAAHNEALDAFSACLRTKTAELEAVDLGTNPRLVVVGS